MLLQFVATGMILLVCEEAAGAVPIDGNDVSSFCTGASALAVAVRRGRAERGRVGGGDDIFRGSGLFVLLPIGCGGCGEGRGGNW